MDMKPLYDVKERLEHAAIAGTGLLGEDFRLRRSAEAMAPLAAASPVFAKISAGLEGLLAAPAEERGRRLLSLLALVDAVAYTQGTTGLAGELTPLESGGGTYCQISYGQIQPLLTALTTTGGGRMEVVSSAYENHPEFFRDYRVLSAVIAGLGDSYGEMAEQNAKILKEIGSDALPLLKRGFDGAGKRDMARRAEVIAAIEGAEATPWLLSVLPESKKDVRAAVIEGLGANAENTALLLDLTKSERGKCREAALSALALQDGETVKAFWTEELPKRGESVSFLAKSQTSWASDLVAEGFKACLERLLAGDRVITAEQNEELRRWSDAAVGKDSPAMLDFWRWASRSQDIAKLKLKAGMRHMAIEDVLHYCLTRGLCCRGTPSLCNLCIELWESSGRGAAHLTHALFAAILTWPAEEVYDQFSGYIRTKKPLAGAEEARRAHKAALKALWILRWNPEAGGYCSYYDDRSNHVLDVTIDRRWFSRLIEAVWKVPEDGREQQYMPYNGGETVGEFDMTLINLANPADQTVCALIVPYLRERMVETGKWSGFSFAILQFHGSPVGALGRSMKNNRKGGYLYHLWRMLQEASKVLPKEELIALLREADEAGGLRAEDIPLSKAAFPYTIAILEEGRPFPDWSEWWSLRP